MELKKPWARRYLFQGIRLKEHDKGFPNEMNEILLVFSAGVLAGIVIGILLVHD